MEARTKPFVIARSRLADFQERMDALVKRSTRLDLEPPSYEIGPAYEIKVSTRRNGSQGDLIAPRRVVVHDVTVAGASPQLEGGWRLAAVIDHRQSHPTLGWLVRRTPDFNEVALPEGIEHTDPTCDHCGTLRERIATFLLLSEAGDWKRVGRQCLRDFLGSKSPEAIASYYEAVLDFVRDLDDWDDDEPGGGRQDVMTKTFLTFVAGAVRTTGAYYSRKSEQEDKGPSTATMAWGRLMSDPEKIDPSDRTTAADYETAGEIIAWGATLVEKSNLSDYERSLAIVLYQEVVAPRSLGLLASAWFAWARETNRLPERNDQKPSVHQGQIGERIERIVRIARRFDSPSNFRYNGLHFFYIMEDEDGNAFTWGTEAVEMAEGETVKIKGTVKKHSEYRGRPQTEMTRCKVLETIATAEQNAAAAQENGR